MDLLLLNEKGELARLGLKVDEDGDKGTGSVGVTFKCKLPLFARKLVKVAKDLDHKEF